MPVNYPESTESLKAIVLKWKHRGTVEDNSHAPHSFKKTMSDFEEFIVIELRKKLLLPLYDLFAINHEFINPNVFRVGLDLCISRHGVSNLKQLLPKEEGEEKCKKTFKDYESGYVHVDVKYLPQISDETRRCYLFVGIDRQSDGCTFIFTAQQKSIDCCQFPQKTQEGYAVLHHQSLNLTNNGQRIY